MATRRQYAANTTVPIGRTKDAIITELIRLGASRRAFYDDDEQGQAAIQFDLNDRRYRFILPLPDPRDQKYLWTPAKRLRLDETRAKAAWQLDCQSRWRGLAEYIKAMRIATELGIIKIEEALLPYTVLPDDQTVAEWLEPQIEAAYASHQMPPLLPGVNQPSVLLITEAVRDEE